MAKITDFYKIASPSQPVVTVTDNQSLDNSYGAISNTSYHRVIQGGASRLARYNEYNAMDNDVEVARALDITAEEMTGKNTKTNLPLDLDIIKEESQEVDDTLITTLNAALRRWCELHGFNDNRLFKLSRNLVKYGDCFFRKTSPYKKWEWVPAADIIGAVVDAHDITNIVGYQVRINTKEPANSTGFANTNYRAVTDIKTEVVPASEMVVFSINDDMSDSAPFGESVLRTVYKTHKQKELLEDAIIIYRIQRAPERRVFYIDVGKMPPNRVKAYLETVKNEMRQKKIPSMNNNGQASVDSVYNPQSQLEDIYLAQRADGAGSKVDVLQSGCLSLDTKIDLLSGTSKTLSELISDFDNGIENWVVSCNPENGTVKPGIISWAGITQKNAGVVELVLSNDEKIICTPDHKFPVHNKGFVQACDLTPRDVIIGNNWNIGDNYTQTFDHVLKTYIDIETVVDLYDIDEKHYNKIHPDYHKPYYGKIYDDYVYDTVKQLFDSGLPFNKVFDTLYADEKFTDIIGKQLFNKNILYRIISVFNHNNIDDAIVVEYTDDHIDMINILKNVYYSSEYNDHLSSLYVDILNQKYQYEFSCLYMDICSDAVHDKIQYHNLYNVAVHLGYEDINHLLKCVSLAGLTVKKYTVLDSTMDVGTLTIDQDEQYHNYHTFGLTCGIFTKNSQLGEQSDLDYFADKVLRGLRVPLSYMKPGDKNALFNDGKMGSAFVEEIQFAKYIERLQVYIEDTLDKEFKRFLFHCNINIDPALYKIRLPKPSSYKQYQQAEIDSTLLNMVGTADGLPSLSKRFVLQRYLQLTEADMLLNEQLLKEERGLSINADKTLQTLYGQPGEGMMGGGMGMGGMGMGGDMGMGGGPDMGMGSDMGMGGEAAMGGPPATGGAPPPPTV